MGETFRISIPADVDGYVLFQCPLCGGLFKVKSNDFEKTEEIYCPSCGMKSDNYITKDVMELVHTIVKNYAEEELYKSFKKLECENHGKMTSFKAGKKPKHESENPISNKMEAMQIASNDCCNKTCKVKPLQIMTGCYCPFCGVREYESHW